jgi:hypothetical protein
MLRRGENRRTRATALFLLMLSLFTASAAANDINACKYLVVTDFTSDPYGIAEELRVQAGAKGFAVVSSVSEVSPAEVLRTRVMRGSRSRDFSGQELAVRIVDAASGELVAEAVAGPMSRLGVGRTCRALVAKVYSQLGYAGYDEGTYRQRTQREYPTRPKVSVTDGPPHPLRGDRKE